MYVVNIAKSQNANRHHAKKTTRPMVEDEAIAWQLSALLTPAITSQENYYRQLGLRGRILNLPLMVAAVLTLLWRDVALWQNSQECWQEKVFCGADLQQLVNKQCLKDL